jgi:tetratricopeptide (TPR) repeat protein
LVQGLLTLFTMGLYGPWALCKFFIWRTQNTIVGGRASRFTGNGASLFIFYLIHLFFLPLITLGLYSIYGVYRLYAWKEEHTQYGGHKTSFGGTFIDFFKIWLISAILNPLTLYIFLPWSMAMLYRWQIYGLMIGQRDKVNHFPQVKTNFAVAILLLLIGLILFLGLAVFVKNKIEKSDDHAPLQKGLSTTTEVMESPATRTGQEPKTLSGPDRQKNKSEYIKEKLGDEELSKELKRVNSLIALDAKNANAYYNRGWLYEYKGETGKAIEDYTKAVSIDRQHVEAFYNRGLIYSRQKKYELAIKDFTEVIKLRKDDSDVYNNRGNAFFQLGKLERALEDYHTAIRLNPRDADLYFNRAIVYRALGENKKAIQDFQKAADLGYKRAKEFLGQN